MVIVVFGVWYGLVLILGVDIWWSYILLVVVLVYLVMFVMMWIICLGMIDVMGVDYICIVYVKGLSGWYVIVGYVVCNVILLLVLLVVV